MSIWSQDQYTAKRTSCHCSTPNSSVPKLNSCLVWPNATTSKRGFGYIRRFQGRAVDCYDPVLDRYLLVFVSNTMEEYMIFLQNLSFSSFSRFTEAACHTKESGYRILRSSSAVRPSPCPIILTASRKLLMVATLEKDKWASPSSSKKPVYDGKESWQLPILSPLPCGLNKATNSLRAMSEEPSHHSAQNELSPLPRRSEGCEVMSYHKKKKKGHTIKQCFTSRGYFMKNTIRKRYCSRRLEQFSLSLSTKIEAKTTSW